MKYIKVILPNGLPASVLFADQISHVDLAEALRKIGCPTQSAGFVRLGKIAPVCVGESTSLRMKPEAGDADLIRIQHEVSSAHSILFGVHALPMAEPTHEQPTPQPLQYHLPA